MTESSIVVFISHVHEDETLSSCLKEFLDGLFLNATVFVSGRDLGGGQVWFEELRRNLETATTILALVSRFSVNNTWVHFEAGAGFSRQRTIPVLADGVSISTLSPPFKLLQARTYDEDGLKAVAKDIARHANLREPTKFPDLDKTLRDAANFIALRVSATPLKPEGFHVPKPSLSDERRCNADPEVMRQADAFAQRTRALVVQDILRRDAAFEIPTIAEISQLDFSDLSELAKAVGANPPFGVTSLAADIEGFVPLSKAPVWEKLNAKRRLEDLEKELDEYERDLRKV